MAARTGAEFLDGLSRARTHASFGLLGRTGDYLNSALMALASAADWFGQADTAYARNIVAYYEKVRDEDLLVFPSTVLRGTPEDKPYSFAFAIPADAKGLRFIAREPFDYGRSHFDHPLGSRFDESDVTGLAAADIDTYLQAATLTGAERVRLFRLVWDTCGSAFASRQALYEYYFFGDPVRTAGAYVASYDKAPYIDRVRDFLSRD